MSFLQHLVRPAEFVFLASLCLAVHAQQGELTWMGGSKAVNQQGVYGTLGTAAAVNIPGARFASTNWTDESGNFWMFGCCWYAWTNSAGYYNDLWKFNPSTQEWTWVGGSSAPNPLGVYGTLGITNTSNIPGGRGVAASWTDNSGNEWIFGGFGHTPYGWELGYLNDLWRWNPTTNEWTWMKGRDVVGSNQTELGVYGTQGTPDAANTPGGLDGPTSWKDSSGNLWLFGGQTNDQNENVVKRNNVWMFNPATDEWTWMAGSSTVPCTSCGQPASYGTLGVAAASNIPGGRNLASSWSDAAGKLWIFGGEGVGASDTPWGPLNDFWTFDPSTLQWTWLGGATSPAFLGVYGTRGVASASNIPASRETGASWTDKSGHLWLFGGTGGSSVSQVFDDLWEFDPASNEWTWMGGHNDAGNFPGVYGTLGVPAGTNNPGSRYAAATWTDNSGNLWMFGGQGYDANGNYGALNDLWEYSLTPSSTKTTPSVTVTPFSSSITTAQTLKVTITVSGASSNPTPTGSVTLSGGGYTSAATTLSGGSATIAIPAGSLAVGSDTLTASYTPDSNSSSNYANSTGTSPQVTVIAAGTSAAAAPTFNPAAGSYSSVQMVELATTNSGARIYYTLDGSTPTTSSKVYSVPIYIGGTITLKAIAVATGYQNSQIAAAVYQVTLSSAATPTFSPGPEKVIGSVLVAISDTTPKSTIHYTLDGSTPLSSSAEYTGPLTLTQSTTVKAIATAPDYWKSSVVAAQYSVVPQAPTPVISPYSGAYGTGQLITISDANGTATIRYTTDGSTPTTHSAIYTHPFSLTGNETVHAIAVGTGEADSRVATATYISTGP